MSRHTMCMSRHNIPIFQGENMKRIISVDVDTGESLEGAVIGMFYPKRNNGFYDGWIAMAQPALMALAKADLGQQTTRVLFALLAKLDFENYILINQAEVAQELDMKRTNVNIAIKQLLELGVLYRGPKAGRSSTFRLNSTFGWKGSAKNHKKNLEQRMKKQGLSIVDGT